MALHLLSRRSARPSAVRCVSLVSPGTVLGAVGLKFTSSDGDLATAVEQTNAVEGVAEGAGE